MKLNFVHTLGGNLFYLGDAEDENAPMLEIRFQNELGQLPQDKKDALAAAMFDAFYRELADKELKRGTITNLAG